jgi:hypothetical protein
MDRKATGSFMEAVLRLRHNEKRAARHATGRRQACYRTGQVALGSTAVARCRGDRTEAGFTDGQNASMTVPK